jgi:hypothetical protein
LGKEKRTTYYLTGVQQWDNTTPVISIFLVIAVYETMKKDCKYKTPTCGHFNSNKCNRSGQINNQNYWTKGDLLEVFHLIFVDDTSFFFESLEDTENGAHTINDLYARFELVMQVQRGGVKLPHPELRMHIDT